MKIKLIRSIFTCKASLGELYVDGDFFCYTLEDKARKRGEKVPGETAIPAGTYPIEITYSPRFKRQMIEVQNVPNFSGVRIHGGNTIKDTSGCILVGFKRDIYCKKGKVYGPQIFNSAEKELFNVFKAKKNDKNTIEIINEAAKL
jgi:hypothetical protein